MFNKKRIQKSLEESLLDYVSGNLSPKEQRRIEEYLSANPDKRHLLAFILKQIHRPPSQQEEEWLRSSMRLTPEQQAEKMVQYYQKANPATGLRRIGRWPYFFAQKLALWRRRSAKKNSLVFVSILLGIGLLTLSWIGVSLYRYVDNLKSKNNLIAEIKQDRVPRSLFLRPAGKNLEPDLFSAQLGQETSFSDSILDKIVLKNSDDAQFLTQIAQHYLLHRNFSMAEEFYKKALRASKNNTLILNDLAVLCHTRGDMWYAYQLLTKAHNQDPKRIEVIYNLALVAQILGKTEASQFWQSEFKRLNTSPAWAELLKEKFDLME